MSVEPKYASDVEKEAQKLIYKFNSEKTILDDVKDYNELDKYELDPLIDEKLPFEDAIDAFLRYYESRVTAMCTFRNSALIGKYIEIFQEKLREKLKNSLMPDDVKESYEDMIKDFPNRVADESSIAKYVDSDDELYINNKVKK